MFNVYVLFLVIYGRRSGIPTVVPRHLFTLYVEKYINK